MLRPIEIHHEVTAPAEVVWAIITDIQNAAQTISGITAVERIDDAGPRHREPWHETREMFGRAATEEMRVTANEAGRSYTTRPDHDKVHYESTLSVEPTGAGTSRLTMTFYAQSSGFLNKTHAAVVGTIMVRSNRPLWRSVLRIASSSGR